MYDEPPPRPFHTFKFPHITVEVETTPQVCHDIYDDMMYDRCILYLKSNNETAYHYNIEYGDMFPHITVEVATTPQPGISWYL